ncbi:MAG: ABC transporter ATP-binding protein [Chloroflexi bacterium]|nr:ABC transporter ATP-binding protein [Chloroflexota bacterium]
MIVCSGLVKIYKVADLETVALQGLDLEVRAGEVLAIVGNSGSGKTTLLNILGGLDRPSAGRVEVAGQNLLTLSDAGLARYRRETVGFVWQQSARNLVPYLTALENVELPMIVAARPPRERKRRATALLAAVGLADRRGHRPPELSGGEQQRVAIAVALANRPPVLLADEPTGELDTETAGGIYGLLRQMNRDEGVTVVVVSHDRAIASHVDRVVSVRDGKVSTETARRAEVADDGESETRLEELVVLDRAGRLQLPRDLVERFGLRGLVRVEVSDDHIAIRPPGGTPRQPGSS